MGTTRVTVRVCDLARRGTPFEADFIVDTGATDCMAPGDRLRENGIQPEGRAVYELANGQQVEYEYGFARIAFMGEETVAQVIFGPEDAEPILGSVPLENVGMAVDPVTQTLRRLPSKPLKPSLGPPTAC